MSNEVAAAGRIIARRTYNGVETIVEIPSDVVNAQRFGRSASQPGVAHAIVLLRRAAAKANIAQDWPELHNAIQHLLAVDGDSRLLEEAGG